MGNLLPAGPSQPREELGSSSKSVPDSSGFRETPHQDPQRSYNADKYIVQNLMWSRVYLGSAVSNYHLQKILAMVPLTTTIPKVYVATLTNFLYDFYYYLKDTINHLKRI